jgi:hypothetical protein
MYNLFWPPYTNTCTSILSVYLCSDLVRPRTYLKFLFFLFAWGIQRHQVGGITRRACIRFNGCYKASGLLEPSRWPQNQSVFSAFSLSVFFPLQQWTSASLFCCSTLFVVAENGYHNGKVYNDWHGFLPSLCSWHAFLIVFDFFNIWSRHYNTGFYCEKCSCCFGTAKHGLQYWILLWKM